MSESRYAHAAQYDEITSLASASVSAETTPKQKIEGLSSIELNTTRRCHGTYLNEEGERVRARFEYKSAELNASEFSLTEAQQKYMTETLGLEDLHFRVFQRPLDHLSGEHPASNIGDYKDKHIYMLLHGWTATGEIFSEVPQDNQLTIVEEILAKDPSAVILVGDFNGFGGTNFNKSTLKSSKFSEKCTVSAYAAQADFLITNVLKVRQDSFEEHDGVIKTVVASDNFRLLGHSMGAATVEELVMDYGYPPEHAVACAPAEYPTWESIEQLLEVHAQLSKLFKESKRRTDLVYTVIGRGMWLGDIVAKFPSVGVGDTVSGAVVSKVYDGAAPFLIGTQVTSGEGNKHAHDKLDAIHASQFYNTAKYPVISQVMLGLRKGRDFTHSTIQQLERYGRITAYEADSDILVPADTTRGARYLVNILATAKYYQSVWDVRAYDPNTSNWPEFYAAMQSTRDAYARSCDPQYLFKGGHYAALFGAPDERVINSLVYEPQPGVLYE